MIKRLLVGVSFLMLGAFGLQAQSSSTQSGSQSGSQYGTQQSGSQGDQYGTQQGNQQYGNQSSSQGNTQLSKTDQDFVRRAYQSNLKEIQMGQLATQKSSNSDVKQFAQQMVDDHTKANDQLKQIAQNKGINLPSSNNNDASMSRFQNLSGSNFDRQYIQNQMQAHKQAVTLFKNESNNGQDPDLKSFASTQLSNLQQHESMVNDLHSKVASNASARNNQPGNLPRSSNYSSSNSSSDNSASDQGQNSTSPSNSSSNSYSSSSTSNSTTNSTTNSSSDNTSNQSNSQMPRTASNMPLVGLFGFMLIAAALILRSYRSLRNNS